MVSPHISSVLAKSLLGKAIAYTYSLIERLGVYIDDGRVNIDNNLIENAIRPWRWAARTGSSAATTHRPAGLQ